MYKFTDDYLIGIDEIDNEHRRLFQMINEAIDLSKESSDISVISKNLVSGLKNYAATHFAHEEAYMEHIHDPELPIQKKEHLQKKSTLLLWILLPRKQQGNP